MATQFDPIAKDQSMNTTESPSRNIADVLAQELSGISTALTTASNTRLHLFNKLWENPSPSSAFASQTITLASGDYDFLLILYRYYIGDTLTLSNIVAKTDKAILDCAFATSAGARSFTRQVNYVNATTLAVGDAQYATASTPATTANGFIIPLAIYGFKKSVDINAIVSSVSTDADKCMMSDGVTNVEQAITALQTPDSISVTGDGVKTYVQLFNTLQGMTDFTKLNPNSVLKFNGVIFHCVRAGGNYARFSWIECTTSDLQNETVRFQSNSSYFRAVTTTSGTTLSHIGSTTLDSGKTIELIY